MSSPMNMDAWLAELEMEIDTIPSLINNPCHQMGTIMEADFDEQLAATLSDEFPYTLIDSSDTTSPPTDLECNVFEQYISTPPISDISENHNNNNNSNNYCQNNSDSIIVSTNKNVQKSQLSTKTEETKKQAVSSGTKRKRQPSQVQDHIMAERKRRELLSQLFISLSAIVPGLKKVDKTTVLGEAIKHMKELQEKVKVLEGVIAKRTVESVVVVKKSKLMFDDGSSDDNVSSSTLDYHSSDDSDSIGNSFPEIEVKISEKTLLLRVYCEQHKDVLTKLFAEVDKHGLTVTNFSAVPFENLAQDITIVAQMERGFNRNIKDFVRTLRNALHLASYQHFDLNDNEYSS